MMLPVWVLLVLLSLVGLGGLADHYIQERRDCEQATKNLKAMHTFLELHRFTAPELHEALLWREKLMKERIEHCGELEDRHGKWD